MLFLVFQIGRDRYALEAKRVVQVLPLLRLKCLPQAPKGVAGVFLYHGQAVPAVDLSELTLGKPAAELFSTRLIVLEYPGPGNKKHLLGLIAEKATEVMQREPQDFVNSGFSIKAAPYLGPVLRDSSGPIQWLREQHLLSGPIQQLLFDSPALLESAATVTRELPTT